MAPVVDYLGQLTHEFEDENFQYVGVFFTFWWYFLHICIIS